MNVSFCKEYEIFLQKTMETLCCRIFTDNLTANIPFAGFFAGVLMY
jgi:hypothetical protein